MKFSKRIPLTLGIGTALVCSGMFYTQTSAAQTSSASDDIKLEEIVVTAERRTSDIQKTAASVEVRSGDDLTKQGKYSLQQILEDVAGVTVTTGLFGAPTAGTGDAPGTAIVIRGAIPNTASAGNAVVPTTAVYTDGIYSGIGGSYDIDRVEVLRGPQGTLYGRSATAGVVSTYTHNPELGNFGVDGTLEVGNYNLKHGTAALNVPLGEQLAFRAAGSYYSRNGFISAEGGYLRSTDGKAKLLYKPTDDFSLLIGWAIESNFPNSGGDSLALPTPTTFQVIHGAVATGAVNRHHQTWAELNWNLGFATLTYLPAYRTYFQDGLTVQAGPADANGNRIPIGSLIQEPTDKFVTHELRLASDAGSMLTWQVGALSYDNSYVSRFYGYIADTSNALIFDSRIAKTTTDLGAFGEATLPFGGSWRATLGLRYDKTKIKNAETYTVASNPFGLAPFPNSISTLILPPGSGDSTFNNVTYKLRLEKDLTASNMVYATVSTGFLPGDVQAGTVGQGPNVQAGATTYDQEKLTAYELGSKNRFLDSRLQLNADVFYYNYKQYQAHILVSPFNPQFGDVTSPAKMYGLEVDGVFQLTANDRVSATYAYINSSFTDIPSCPGSTTSYCFAEVVANTKIPNIAPVTVTTNYDHSFHLPGGSIIDLHADARYESAHQSTYILPAQTPYAAYSNVDGEWVGDLSLSWTSAGGKYAVTSYVRNVADNDYKNGAQLSGLDATFSATATKYDPRTWGVILRAGF